MSKEDTSLFSNNNFGKLVKATDEDMFSHQFRFYNFWKQINKKYENRIDPELEKYPSFIDTLDSIHVKNQEMGTYPEKYMLFDMAIKMVFPTSKAVNSTSKDFVFDRDYILLYVPAKKRDISMQYQFEEVENEDYLEANSRIRGRLGKAVIKLNDCSLTSSIADDVKRQRRQAELNKKVDEVQVCLLKNEKTLETAQKDVTRSCVAEKNKINGNANFIMDFNALAKESKSSTYLDFSNESLVNGVFLPVMTVPEMRTRLEVIDKMVYSFMIKQSRLSSVMPTLIYGVQPPTKTKTKNGKTKKKTLSTGKLGISDKSINDILEHFYDTTDTAILHDEFSIFGDDMMFEDAYNKYISDPEYLSRQEKLNAPLDVELELEELMKDPTFLEEIRIINERKNEPKKPGEFN